MMPDEAREDAAEGAAAGDDERPTPAAEAGGGEDEEDDEEERAAADEAADAGARRPPRSGRRRGRPSRSRGRPLSSDEAAFRWTVRGVPVHVRAIALKAADERGMTVGDWLAEAIVAFSRGGVAAHGNGGGAAAGGRRSNLPATESPPDLAEMVKSIDRRLTALEEERSTGFLGRLFGRRKRQTGG